MANDQETWLAYRNWVESSGVTFTTAAAAQGDLVAKNVATRESDDAWRVDVSSDHSASITIDFGQDREVGVITQQFPRGTYPGVSDETPSYGSSDTIQYILQDASDTTLYDSTVEASGVVAGFMTHWKRPSSAITARKLIVNYSAPSRVSAGFFDVGLIGAWPVIEPSVGLAYPADFGWMANAGRKKTAAGRTYTARFDPMRRWRFIFDALTNADSLEIDELIRYSGGARQIFARRGDLPAGKDAMHCLLQSARPIGSLTAAIRQSTLELEEFI